MGVAVAFIYPPPKQNLAASATSSRCRTWNDARSSSERRWGGCSRSSSGRREKLRCFLGIPPPFIFGREVLVPQTHSPIQIKSLPKTETSL